MRIIKIFFLTSVFFCSQVLGMESSGSTSPIAKGIKQQFWNTFLKIVKHSNDEILALENLKRRGEGGQKGFKERLEFGFALETAAKLVDPLQQYLTDKTAARFNPNDLPNGFFPAVNAAFAKIDLLATTQPILPGESKPIALVGTKMAKFLKLKIFVQLLKLFTEGERHWYKLWITKSLETDYRDKLVTKLVVAYAKPIIAYNLKTHLETIKTLFEDDPKQQKEYINKLEKFYKFSLQAINDPNFYSKNSIMFDEYLQIVSEYEDVRTNIHIGSKVAQLNLVKIVDLQKRVSTLLHCGILTGAIERAGDIELQIAKSQAYWGVARNLLLISLTIVIVYVLTQTDAIDQASPTVRAAANQFINSPTVSTISETLKSQDFAQYKDTIKNSEVVKKMIAFITSNSNQFLAYLQDQQILETLKGIKLPDIHIYVEYLASIPVKQNLLNLTDFAARTIGELFELLKSVPGITAIPGKIWLALGVTVEATTGIGGKIVGAAGGAVAGATQTLAGGTVKGAAVLAKLPVSIPETIWSLLVNAPTMVTKAKAMSILSLALDKPVWAIAKIIKLPVELSAGALQLIILTITGAVRFSTSIPTRLRNLLCGEIVNVATQGREYRFREIKQLQAYRYHDLYTLTNIQNNLIKIFEFSGKVERSIK